MYKLVSNGVIRLEDRAFIFGPDMSNPDWVAYQDWCALGNTPLPEYSLEQLKSIKIDSINQECESSITGGFASSALGAPHIYDSSIEDQLNLIGSLLASQALPSVPFRCRLESEAEKSWQDHTPSQMQQVYFDGVTFKTTQLMIASGLKAQILAATSELELQAITWAQ